MKAKSILIVLLVVPQLLVAQNTRLWQEPVSNLKLTDSRWEGVNVNRQELNREELDVILGDIKKNGSATFPVPHPQNGEITFEVNPANLLAKGLQEKFPNIRTYKGVNKNGDVVRIDVSKKGVHAIAFTREGTIYLDPESPGSNNHVSYFSADYKSKNKKYHEKFRCEPMGELPHDENTIKSACTHKTKNLTIGSQLRKYRIAIAAASNYTNYHGGTVEDGLSAVVTALNRVTGIYERELGITFEMVADNDKIIFIPGSNPYAGLNMQQRRIKNQEITDSLIGFDNYDIGHLVTAINEGGQAFFEGVCKKWKAATSTGISNPNGDFFYLKYMAHEIGHQFGAFHTWSGKAGYCTSAQYRWDAAYEPGSGTTMMAYAGLCGSDNVQDNTNYYFHAGSIENITSTGNECASLVETGNTPPDVTLMEGGFVIPVNTPFVLEATGSDVDGDDLTYCWEQYDRGAQANLGSPTEDGPLFRSFPPKESNARYFPKLSKVMNGQLNGVREMVPWNTRELNFMVTVRDNNVNGGGVTCKKLTFSSTDQAGPFSVTSGFSGSPYDGFSTYVVEWDVANTNQEPVNCQKVDILFSDNGGESFDYFLLENTDNDGSENIQLPNIETSKARIMVKAADNIFFNVNNADFTINSVTVAAPEGPTSLAGSRENNFKIALSWTDNSTVENGFIIERQAGDNPDFEEIAGTGFDVTSYEDETVDETTAYSYRVAAYNSTGTSEYSNVVSFGTPVTGVSTLGLNEKGLIYPNPTTGEIYLSASLAKQAKRAMIFDLNGKKLSDIKVSAPMEKLDVSGFDSGLYLLKISTSDREVSAKFYKK